MQLAVEVEDLSSVKKKLAVEIPAETVSSELESVSQAWRKEARIPGFRKGRAPLALVKRSFQKEIRNEVIQRLVPDSYHKALEQQSWRPVGEPQIGEINLPQGGGALRYVAHLEVLPEIKLPPYEGLKVEDVDETVSAQEVASALQELRERHARLEAVEDRPIQPGDHAVVDLHGEYLPSSDDPEESLPDPIDDEDVQVEVGGENTHEAFTSALTGMNLAEEKTFDVSYPQDYPEKKLAGKRVRFKIEVSDVKAKVLPELDDEFARSVGDFEHLEGLQDKVRSDLQEDKKKGRESQLRNRLLQSLVDQTGFEVPETLIEERIDSKLRQVAYNIASRGVDPAQAGVDWTRVRQDMRPRAESEVRGELILDQVAAEQKIEVADADEQAEIARTAKSMNASTEQVRAYFQQEGRMEGLRTALRRRVTLEWLIEHAEIG